MAETKMMCTVCGKDKKLKDFYLSSSPIHKYYQRLTVCKECLISMVDTDDTKSVMNVLRMIDKPFIASLYDSSIKESKGEDGKENKNVFRTYMKNVVMQQYRDKNWSDSEFNDEVEDYIVKDDYIDQDAIDRWRGWSKEDIHRLEEKYQELINNYEHDTPIQKSIYKNIAVTQMKADDAIASGNTNEYQKLMKVISDLMNDANIKPLQETGANSGEQATFGNLIKKFENEDPIPEPEEEWKDVDGIKWYISVWFLGHLCKMMGIKNEYTEMYDKEIDKYAVNPPVGDEKDEDD